jgi:hypothetical protein
VQIRKGKLCGRTLKIYQIYDKLNLNIIFKSYVSYHDLQGLRNSLDYFERLQKKLFVMIQQLGPSTFFLSLLHLLKDYEIIALKFYMHYMLQD